MKRVEGIATAFLSTGIYCSCRFPHLFIMSLAWLMLVTGFATSPNAFLEKNVKEVTIFTDKTSLELCSHFLAMWQPSMVAMTR